MELLFIYQRNFKTFYNELTVLLFVDRSEWWLVVDRYVKLMLMLGDSAADWDEDRGVTLVRWEEVRPGPPSHQSPPPSPSSRADTDHPGWLLVTSVQEHSDKTNTGLSGQHCLGKKSLWKKKKNIIILIFLSCTVVAWHLFDIPSGVPWSMNWISTFQWISWKVSLWIFLNIWVGSSSQKTDRRSNLSSKVNSPREEFPRSHHS